MKIRKAVGEMILTIWLICEELAMQLSSFLNMEISYLLGDFFTPNAIMLLSNVIAYTVIVVISIRVLIWLYQGLGHIITKLTTIFFSTTGTAVNSIFKGFISGIFTSVGWMFTSIGRAIKKLFS